MSWNVDTSALYVASPKAKAAEEAARLVEEFKKRGGRTTVAKPAIAQGAKHSARARLHIAQKRRAWK